jgi:hypothetical protein
MLNMPVSTLRVWERRYGLTQAAVSPSGQRLYSAEDVHRLGLIKQLTEHGHAIGSLAPLDLQALQRVAATHAQARAAADDRLRPSSAIASPGRAWRLAVVGATLAARLQRPALLRRLGRPVQLLGPYADLAQAGAAMKDQAFDALLVQAPHLQADWPASLTALAPGLTSVPTGLLYGFASDATCEALASAGLALLREPQPDAVLAQWLAALATAPASAHEAELAAEPAPPPRWDEAALAEFAGRSSTIACECPRHVAELLMLLSHFEAYSAECESRSTADAQLHGYLRQTAAAARARFEAALEHVALHEGLLMPAPRLPAARHAQGRAARATRK